MLEAVSKTRPVLDRPTIVRTALVLLDEVGMDGLSTRRLAAELGVKGPSLYWHFKNKNDLLANMAGALYLEALPAPVFDTPGFDLFDWLIKGARGLRKTALSRRDGAVVMARIQPVVDDDRRAFSEMTRCLQVHSGLPAKDCSLALLSLGRFAISWALYENAAGDRVSGPDWEAGFEFGLQTFMRGLQVRINEIKPAEI